MTPPFPFIDCDRHGRQQCYIVCVHVLGNPSLVSHVIRSSDTEIGEILCSECVKVTETEGPVPDTSRFKVVCAEHCRSLLPEATTIQ